MRLIIWQCNKCVVLAILSILIIVGCESDKVTKVTIIKDTITIEPQDRYERQFYVSPDMKFARLKGTFEVISGGVITVGVLDLINFEMLQLGTMPVSSLYTSGAGANSGEINIQINPGAYYLVFSNNLSLVKREIVKINIYLEYE